MSVHLPVAQLDEQRATNAKVCRFESCPEGQSSACRGVRSSLPALEAGDRVFKSHHADHFAFVDPWRNRNAAVCKTVMSRGSTGRVIHTSSFAGLGHRLITWLPTRQSRFESGSPHHRTLRLSARIPVFQTEEASSILAGCANSAGSFSGMTARFERAYEGSIPSPATSRSASREGLLLITANRTVRNRYERPFFRSR